MTLLVVGLILFLGSHSISIVAPSWRDGMLDRLGEGPWKGLYGLVALAGFVLLIWGYGLARLEAPVLYTPPYWFRYPALVLMVFVFPLFVATYLPGRISEAAKHPTLLATKLWAVVHLLVNGGLADVVLFGAFLAWAVADRISLQRRPARALPGAPPSPRNDAIAIVVGLLIYLAFILGAHRWLFGVPVLAALG